MTFTVLSRRLKHKPASRGHGPRLRRSFRPGVEVLEERQLLSTFIVTTTADNGDDGNPTAGSLREAILQANANANPAGDLILFQIPGAGVHTIQPPTGLPVVTDRVTISGITQSGAKSNTAADTDNANLEIVLDGSLLNNAENGLTLASGNSVVNGLVIDNFSGWGIYLKTAGNDTVSGNFIGTDISGQVAKGNGLGGVGVDATADGNFIGTAALGDRNVISGNGLNSGIFLGSNVNSVQNNYVGTDIFRNVGPANFIGIDVQGLNNTIGGTLAGQGNVISGNTLDGVVIEGAITGNLLAGNQILFNQDNGVQVDNGASDNFIGSLVLNAPANVISFNKLAGVRINGGTGNEISGGNSITANGGPGILLLNNGNNNQAAPVLASAVTAGGQTTVTGTLHSTLNSMFTLRFFFSPAFDPDQGTSFLGEIDVMTDGNGNASFAKTYATDLTGLTMTATATAVGNNTSEFSAPVTVTMPAPSQQPPPVPGPVQDVTPHVSVLRGKLRHRGGLYRQTITLRNDGAALAGPLYLVLDHLTRKVRLLHPTGRTAQKAPLGDPYMVAGPAGQVFGAGATRTLVLTFRNPLGRKIRYNPRVLAGVGPP
jgi:CSLREA domain-containing protein